MLALETPASVPEKTLNSNESITILSVSEVCKKLGISRSYLYAKQRFNPNRPTVYDPTFPKPIRLSKTRPAWFEHEIDEWLQSRAEERNH